MWYATHAMAQTRATRMHCFGSGEMREELRLQYGNSYPIETAIFELARPNLSAEVTRTLFHCARSYMESFVIYGENACYEWQMENEAPMLFDASPVVPGEVRSIVEGRESSSGAVTAANWTAAGICAHQSAMAGGDEVAVPAFA